MNTTTPQQKHPPSLRSSLLVLADQLSAECSLPATALQRELMDRAAEEFRALAAKTISDCDPLPPDHSVDANKMVATDKAISDCAERSEATNYGQGFDLWRVMDRMLSDAYGYGMNGIAMDMLKMRDRFDDALATHPPQQEGAAVPDGWVLVPRDVIEAMSEIRTVYEHNENGPDHVRCEGCNESARRGLYAKDEIIHMSNCPRQWAIAYLAAPAAPVSGHGAALPATPNGKRPYCAGTNCTADGKGAPHSSECMFEHRRAVASGILGVEVSTPESAEPVAEVLEYQIRGHLGWHKTEKGAYENQVAYEKRYPRNVPTRARTLVATYTHPTPAASEPSPRSSAQPEAAACGGLREAGLSDAEIVRFLRCGGWEVLQDPKYWTPDRNFYGAVAAAMADIASHGSAPPTEQAKPSEQVAMISALREGLKSNGCEIVDTAVDLEGSESGPWVRNVRAERAEALRDSAVIILMAIRLTPTWSALSDSTRQQIEAVIASSEPVAVPAQGSPQAAPLEPKVLVTDAEVEAMADALCEAKGWVHGEGGLIELGLLRKMGNALLALRSQTGGASSAIRAAQNNP